MSENGGGWDAEVQRRAEARGLAYREIGPMCLGWYVEERLGSKAIAGRLNERGYVTRHGKRWTNRQVVRVLRYLGVTMRTKSEAQAAIRERGR